MLVDQRGPQLAWPMRPINSRVLAPDAAAKWFPVCRRSWKWRSAGTRSPAALARFQIVAKFPRRGVAPYGPTKTRPSEPGSSNVSRWYLSSGTNHVGSATERTPACVLGSLITRSEPASEHEDRGRKRQDLREPYYRAFRCRLHSGALDAAGLRTITSSSAAVFKIARSSR